MPKTTNLLNTIQTSVQLTKTSKKKLKELQKHFQMSASAIIRYLIIDFYDTLKSSDGKNIKKIEVNNGNKIRTSTTHINGN